MIVKNSVNLLETQKIWFLSKDIKMNFWILLIHPPKGTLMVLLPELCIWGSEELLLWSSLPS